MYSLEDTRIINLADGYTLLYFFIVRKLIAAFGLKGEAAAREGTRRFGRDRGITSREKHLEMNAKINMQSLFSLTPDLPGDPRFRRELQRLWPEERVSHTLVCPMADTWKAYGGMAIGRIYCEEFHFACYNTYAYGLTHVNLAKTLTQEGDEYCAFNIVLRPQDVPEELKPQCFAQFDPDWDGVIAEKPPFDGREGFEILWVKLYYYLLEAAVESFGAQGAQAVREALGEAALDAWQRMVETSRTYQVDIDDEFIYQNYPLNINEFENKYWAKYSGCDSKEIVRAGFIERIEELKAGHKAKI